MKKLLFVLGILFIAGSLRAGSYYDRTTISTTTQKATKYISGDLIMYNNLSDDATAFMVQGGSVTLTGTIDGVNVSAIPTDYVNTSSYQTIGGSKTWSDYQTFGSSITFSSHTVIRGDTSSYGAIIASGTFESGWTEPNLGVGTRMLWYPRKGAFRAGTVSGEQWDDEFIGSYSVAFGYATEASGDYAVAMGRDTEASEDYAVAMGYYSVAAGTASVAMGQSVNANADNSLAFGRNFTNNTTDSFSIGFGEEHFKVTTTGTLLQYPSGTEAELKLLSPAMAYMPYVDTTNNQVLISTGTAPGSFALISSFGSWTGPTGW